MEIRCAACHAVIQIPDERVPAHGAFRISCPRCKRKIQVERPTPATLLEDQVHLHSPQSLMEQLPPLSEAADAGAPKAIDRIQPGQSPALLCVNEGQRRRELQIMLEASGYVVDMPATIDQVLQRLRFNQYQIILLDDDFEGKSPNPVAEHLAMLNMSTRREMFVVLIGERFKTADHLQAFMESVNLILHPDDLPHIATLIDQGLHEHERFYKVFTQCLVEAGKKL
jgi:predicted Zn finger-like uncharacterized protein